MPSSPQSLHWRYATKRYDTTKKLTDDQRELIKEALRLSPSSFGLQPWKFVHVTDPELRKRLREAAWDQPQVTEASDFFVICSSLDVDDTAIDHFVEVTAKTRNVSTESLAGFRKMMTGSMNGRTPEQRREWASRQAYIALGVAIAIAAENGIDTSPMEGFDPKKFDEILELDKEGVRSCAMFAVGFRSPDDAYQHAAKVRFDQQEVFIEK